MTNYFFMLYILNFYKAVEFCLKLNIYYTICMNMDIFSFLSNF